MVSFGCGRLAAQPRTGARRFTLSGTVVDAGNRPLAGVELTLQTERWKDAADPAISDAQGRFVFSGLPGGEYILTAEGSGFGTVQYGESPDAGWVSSIRVGGQSGDKTLVFRIVPRGMIEGVVRDEFGDPMVNATVSAVRPVWREGRPAMSNMATKSTDDRGRFRFGNLAPGNYTVCAAANASAPVPGPVDFAARPANRSYARTCNRAFQLSPGQRAQVDLNPTTVNTATVRGQVRNVPPQNGFSAYLQPEGENETGGIYNGFVDGTRGTFTIRGVPPGHYRLQAQSYSTTGGQPKPLTADLPVEVAGPDIDGLDVSLDAEATVDAVVHGLAENAIDPDDFSLALRRMDANNVNRGPLRGKDGQLHFDSVAPGNYRLNTQTSGNVCVESMRLGDRELRGARFDISGGAALRLDVTVSKNCGAIRARPVRENVAVPGAKVVLLFSGTPKDPGQIIEDFANDEGEFLFMGLPPGRYLLWAWAVAGDGAIAGPASLAAVEQRATTVDVTAGEPLAVDVPILAEEGKGQ
jgi:protocatechuate 3,4-dioxygenase beta subunit